LGRNDSTGQRRHRHRGEDPDHPPGLPPLLFKTNVAIDGFDTVQSWGSHFFPTAPGRHEVRVSFRYIFSRTMGENSIVVDVAAGQTVHVQYRSPWLVFLKGSLKITG
jgi:hypothetical protein